MSPKLIDFGLPLLLFLFTFVLASLFAWRTPRWQAPDEPAHYAYVQHVAETGRPPILVAQCYNEAYKNALVSSNFAEEVDFRRFCYEAHQPPLFYYLAAPVYLLSGGSLLALRLFCALLGAGVVVAAWGIVRAAGGDWSLALATAGLVALVPQHLAIMASLNNDALTFLIVALTAWQIIRLLRASDGAAWPEKDEIGPWLKLSVLSALALLTKTLAWVVLPLEALMILLFLQKNKPAKVMQRAALLAAIALLFILPWFARNIATYGGRDILGLERHEEIAIGQPRTVDEIAVRGLMGTMSNGLQTTFHSFWGQFGWMKAPLKAQEYQILALFSFLALLGLIIWLVRRSWKAWGILDGRVLLIFALWAITNAGLLLYYNLEFVQYQGRYLFSALTPIAFFLMVGLGAWLPKRFRPLPWALLLLFLLYLDFLAILERLPGMINY
ncbi:MAG: glycosyltransferase family 39 protein [Ardenticatenaceae bacterium]